MRGLKASEHARPDSDRAKTRTRPLVTIIVPVLDGEAYLRESLDSILGQTHRPLEVIVMDDGSTDGTAAIVASYGDLVECVRQPSTRGIYANANDGIGRARGELVGIFHADDVYLPELVEREVDWLLAHPEAGAVFCSDIFVGADGGEIGRLELPAPLRGSRPLGYSEVLNALLTYKNVFLRCPTALVRTSVYRELGGYDQEQFKNTSDLEMWLRIARSYSIGVLEEHLLLYRRGHGSSSERYHQRRTAPNRSFAILDLELANAGRAAASAAALRAYEAHRAEDLLHCAISHYILNERSEAKAVLGEVHLRRLAASRAVQRSRLLPLALGLILLVRIPWIAAVARTFDRRWHKGSGTTAAGTA
jgi:glycosyltransferase involved in cell wall biosynthesis